LDDALGGRVIAREPEATARSSYDLVVVGGGVYGVALTLEAARRGLSPLLLEARDFGGGTSWNSMRIVHGGLRYLQALDLHRFRESVRERRWWLATFPELVFPLPCLMPVYGRGLRRPKVLAAALAVDGLLSRDRNRGVRTECALPSGRVLSTLETMKLCPAVEERGLQGGALWYDATMPDSHRLLIEMLHWAVACGGRALNYVEATRLLLDDGQVYGVAAVDRCSGNGLELRAPVVVNCAGPHCRELAAAFDRDVPRLFHRSIALNVLLEREPPSQTALAVCGPAPDSQTYFLYPWKGGTLAGTFHAACGPDADIDEILVPRFLEELAAALPGFAPRREEVSRVLWGFLPARREGSRVLAVRERIVHHQDRGGPAGLFSVSGVKFTTARLVAEKTLGKIQQWRGEKLLPPSGPDRGALQRWPTSSELERLLECSEGSALEEVRTLMRRESVVCLSDLMLRRTDWGLDRRRGDAIAACLAPLVAGREPGTVGSEGETRRDLTGERAPTSRRPGFSALDDFPSREG
jgi:glycerol-3-phosphate dehydrogenase